MDIREIELSPGYQDGLDLDVAIVGAGVSGLYSAYRLMTGTNALRQGYPPGRVQMFEMGDRIGGRLESVTLPGMAIPGELGGMRYMTSQAIVTTLIEQVFADQLTPVDFGMGDDAHHFVYLRKQRLRADAWTEAQRQGEKLVTRYFLDQGDVGYSADQLFNKVVYDVLMEDPWFVENYPGKVSHTPPYDYTFQLDSREWDGVKPNLTYRFEGPYQGIKLNDLGFWNVIKDRVSQEGFQFLADAGGYYSNTINWNAAEAFPYMVGDFSDASVSYRTIRGGYDLIAYALAGAYLRYPGSKIWSENRFVTFAHSDGPRRYRLVFFNRREQREWSVFVDNLILAMPRRSLELLDQLNFFFDQGSKDELQDNLRSVIIEPSLKILMGFDHPWWRDQFQADAGHSITDLPMRQCYYFGTDPDNGHSLFLASYNDMRTVPFWDALVRHADLFEPAPTKLVSTQDLEPLRSLQAPASIVQEAINQVREMHGPKVQVPVPYVTLFKDWSEDPYGGGYHAWRAGYSIKDVMPYMRRADPHESIFICGEAYSDQQGWVEGALCVAERMLQEHFGMAWPEWLDKGYYLGW